VAHPDQLGKYRITGVLGEGAMGVVYRGFDPDIRRVVALKTIRRGGDGGESSAISAARFRNEARSAGRLTHPGIVGVYDFGESDAASGRVTYIAMEYVEGHNLAAYLARPVRFGMADIVSIAAQLLEALGHAHEHAVWHRDIKPANMIVTRMGRMKIADFGIARFEDSGLTMAGGMVGTPIYMSPEQYLGGTIDHRVDLYAVGVVLYQLIAGRPPFSGSTDSLSYRVVHEAPKLPSLAEGASVLPQLDSVVMRALAKEPAERFSSAAEFRAAMEAAVGMTAPPAVSEAAVNALGPARDVDATVLLPARLNLASGGGPREGGSSGAADGQAGSQAGSKGSRSDVTSVATSLANSNWEPATLAAVEATLARHVGPLAGTMVRRAARECADLPALHARLAEQISQESVRQAFLGQLRSSATGGGSGSRSGSQAGAGASSGSGSGSGSGTSSRPASSASSTSIGGTRLGTGMAPPPATGGSSAGGLVSEAWLEQANRVLSSHLGPIARVVLKRACERTRQRVPLMALLVEAAPEATRARLRAELDRVV